MSRDLPDRLVAIVRSTPWLMQVLQVVRDHGPPQAWVAAGVVRDTVWNSLTGQPSTGPFGDVDVVHFAEGSEADDADCERSLCAQLPNLDFEVVNQARVHLWHAAQGREVDPATSVAAGLRTWPETATAVAVRLTGGDLVEVLAPLGLDDLFALTVRHNPVVADASVYEGRVASKRWRSRWPGLVVLPGSSVVGAVSERRERNPEPVTAVGLWPMIETSRLVLRPFCDADLDPFVAMRADPEVARYQSWSDFDRAAGDAFFARNAGAEPGVPGGWFQFAITLDGGFVGDCALHTISAETAELGITLSAAAQRRGIATEALAGLMGWLQGRGVRRILAIVDARNGPANALLEALGFHEQERNEVEFKGAMCVEITWERTP